ncbi:TraR/DksA family transcriptional regulator [Cryobacterium roopkundense]|uniref:RNA polymerase-binding transcription factor DksA n=1 Tax=Cryobacterium roopkundense TaxID=1001240 RepID=A0A7W8ZTQ4_9MICO|nr:TraR/DksA C4-type zinc finger protein [Cryobacterium roopkundense]MBB5640023.1 RNA polymerase-binding transcription factor DksA [Cryobacterium roopkundense]
MVMTALTTADVRHFEKNLQRMRVELVAELDRLSGSLDDVREARDGTQDDEHDPEGPTLTMEWSRLSGVHHEFAEKLARIDRALERVANDTYGFCTRRGEAIGRDRLEAQPATEYCIACARELEAERRR